MLTDKLIVRLAKCYKAEVQVAIKLRGNTKPILLPVNEVISDKKGGLIILTYQAKELK